MIEAESHGEWNVVQSRPQREEWLVQTGTTETSDDEKMNEPSAWKDARSSMGLIVMVIQGVLAGADWFWRQQSATS
jgi:hypothetical protein